MEHILTLTNRQGRVLFEAFRNENGTFDYRAVGGGGSNLTKEMILNSAKTVSYFHGAKSAKATGELAAEYDAMPQRPQDA